MGLVPFPSVGLKPAPVEKECRVKIKMNTLLHFIAVQNILVLWIQNIHLFQVKVRVVLVLKPWKEGSVGML